MTGDILAWQPEQVALCCSGVNFLTLMIFMSFGLLSLGGLPHDPVVLGRRTVAGLAVDARLCPGGLVRVGLEIVVGRELAHVAVVAAGVEGVTRSPSSLPVDPSRAPGKWRTPLAAVSNHSFLLTS